MIILSDWKITTWLEHKHPVCFSLIMSHLRKQLNACSCLPFQKGLEGTYETVGLLGFQETKQGENGGSWYRVRAWKKKKKRKKERKKLSFSKAQKRARLRNELLNPEEPWYPSRQGGASPTQSLHGTQLLTPELTPTGRQTCPQALRIEKGEPGELMAGLYTI